MPWEFFDYVDAAGRNRITDWLHRLPPSVGPEVKAALTAQLLWMAPEHELKRPFTGKLIRECAGLYEIIFKVQGVQYRPLFCYGPDRRQATLLIGATKRGRHFDPTDACTTALRRKAEILADNRRVCPHDY